MFKNIKAFERPVANTGVPAGPNPLELADAEIDRLRSELSEAHVTIEALKAELSSAKKKPRKKKANSEKDAAQAEASE